ncbi:MAG: hypothetical protein M3P49_09955 [Actinomycetota bacterium]|nr:hypothetical protein [Actinomycetota bacterium]
MIPATYFDEGDRVRILRVPDKHYGKMASVWRINHNEPVRKIGVMFPEGMRYYATDELERLER